MNERPSIDPAVVLPPDRPLKTSMGWSSFATEPPHNHLIHVYIVNDEGYAWIADAYWDANEQAIVHTSMPQSKLGPNARIYCWRSRPPEPIEKFLDRCPPVAWRS